MHSQTALIAALMAGGLALLTGCERSSPPPVAHEVSGPISSIDYETGIIEIDAEPANLRMGMAPGAIQDLSIGEVITANVVLARATEPVRAYDAPAPQDAQPPPAAGDRPIVRVGQHSVSGKVIHVDHSTGVFDVGVGNTILTFSFPPDDVRDLDDGEEVTLRVAFTKPG